MADRVGFEPTLGFRPKHTFQACAFNHSATYPYSSSPVFRGFGARRAPCKIKDFIPCGTVPSDISRVPPCGRYHSPTTRPPIHIIKFVVCLILFFIQIFYIKCKKKIKRNLKYFADQKDLLFSDRLLCLCCLFYRLFPLKVYAG